MTNISQSNSVDDLSNLMLQRDTNIFGATHETNSLALSNPNDTSQSTDILPENLTTEIERPSKPHINVNKEQTDTVEAKDINKIPIKPVVEPFNHDATISIDTISTDNIDCNDTHYEHSNEVGKDHWWITGASYIGNMHIEKGIECQDSYQFKKLANDMGIAVVCDGAGSKVNSKQGADLVAKRSVEWLAQIIENAKYIAEESLPGIANDLYEYIYSELKKYSEENTLPFESLGSTLIAVIYSPEWLACFHIGDGRAAYQKTDDKSWEALLDPWNTEEGYTIFTTTNEIKEAPAPRLDYIRSRFISGSVASFAIMSDGCENASFECQIFDSHTQKYIKPNRPFSGFFNPVKKQLINIHHHFNSLEYLTDEEKQKSVNEVWQKFLKQGTTQLTREADDRTMIFAINSLFNDD